MPPQDQTPVGDAMAHRFPEQKIPQPKPGASEQRRIERDTSAADIPPPAAVCVVVVFCLLVCWLFSCLLCLRPRTCRR